MVRTVFENEFIRQGILFDKESRPALRSGMDVAKILRGVLDATGLKQARLADEIGVGQGTISKWMNDRQSPNKRQWDAVLAFMRRDDRTVHLLREATPGLIEVPLLSWVSAGKLADAAEEIPGDDVRTFGFTDLGTGEFFALQVEGDSMDHVSPDGSIIVVDRADRELIAGKPYVFFHRTEGTTYKRWRPEPPRLEPFSWNTANQSIFIKRKTDFGVIGRVRRTMLDLYP